MPKAESVTFDNNLWYSKPNNDICNRCRIFEKVSARSVLYFLSWSGFLVSFIMRTDMNLTILAMVKETKLPQLINVTEKHCYTLNYSWSSSEYAVDYGGTLEWSPNIQYYILTSFFWSYILSQIIGGIITQKLGTKIVFGYAQLITALCSILIPSASMIHYSVVIIIRVIQGFACGFTWPAMYAIIAHWIPMQERSRFVSSFQGLNVGTGISFGLCGFLISAFGWRSVFYTTGSMGIIWCIAWYFLAFDSPEIHPRISLKEKHHIRENTYTTLPKRQTQVPWLSILLSKPVWAIGITSMGRIWVHYTFAIYGPLYMKAMLGFSVEKNGLLSGAPFIGSYLSSLLFCYLADKLITYHLLSVLTVRKMLTGIAQVIPGLLCILLGYLGCNIILILLVLFVATMLLAASFAGVMANIVDISPNFAGPVLAFSQTVFLTCAIFSPLVATYFIKDGHTFSAWRSIFNIAGCIVIGTYFVYQMWGSADIQPWDYAANSKNNESMLPHRKRKKVVLDIDEKKFDTSVL